MTHDESQMTDLVGAVAVIGAGIGGMQAALDLAESGFKVYLVEAGPAIGGAMAQLDKTFPTNDCAMCIMSPKLVETGRHLNIEILTLAEVAALEGHAGDFTLRVRRKPRFVDVSKCTGCGDCALACPIDRPDEFNAGLSERKAIYKHYPQAIPNAYAIEKRGEAPCRNACPIEQRAMGYVALIRAGRFADAYRTIREDNPFPSVCGRVCNHRCEDNCARAAAGDTAVSIMRLKRFVSDWAQRQTSFATRHPSDVNSDAEGTTGDASRTPAVAPPGLALPPGRAGWPVGQGGPTGATVTDDAHRVAVIGAGPAGLTCAADLARAGCAVTVFEALPVAGGMMRVGIPAYRLPYDRLQSDIDDVLALGIDLQLNRRIEDAPGLLDQGFGAVFIATGAHAGLKLPIPGRDLPEVWVATDFLRDVSLHASFVTRHSSEVIEHSIFNMQHLVNRRVLVLGGGNVAVDAAMSALRLGAAWVGMACLESRDKMPAHAWEVRDAEEEGIALYPARTFKEIIGLGGHVAGVRMAAIDFRGFCDGRPAFDELPGAEETVPCDLVIFAIGQRPDLGLLRDRVATARGRTVAVDPATLATDLPGLFAGGDVVTGTAFVVDAIAAGHRAARAMLAYLESVAHARAGELSVPLAPRGEAIPPALPARPVPWPPAAAEPERPATAQLAPAEAAALLVRKPGPRAEPARRPAAERRRDFGEVEAALSEAQAVAEAQRCLECGICAECLQCAYACRAGAVRHADRPEIVELQVGAVILAPGLRTVAGDIRPEFGYGVYPNVVTSLEFERMLSASGPSAGVVRRPSDGRRPRRVAFIQCVGSRDCSKGQDYCSSVCCMYATKEALIAREHDARIEPAIFYMDIRAFGKGFERYYRRAADEQGVRYVRSMVSCVKEAPGSRDLRVLYAGPDGHSVEETFDLVVLATGVLPAEGTRALAGRLGVQLNRFGFAESPPYSPGETNLPGVYVAGAFAAPKDIPETVVEASCAAAHAARLLAPARGTLTRQPVYPAERDVTHEPARVGVFVCHCGINIGGVVNVPDVVAFAQGLPGVVYAEHNLYTCSQDTQERIKQRIAEYGLNRVVVASCTPRTHEPLFQDTIRQAGLNPYLFELANIREQDSWVHRADRDGATAKACAVVAMAVAKAARLRPLYRLSLDMDRRALVAGGGLAGLTAALSIAEQGFDVHLVERAPVLGGNLRHIYIGAPGPELASPVACGAGVEPARAPAQSAAARAGDPQALLAELIDRVSGNPRIHVRLAAEIVGVAGYVGQYRTTIRGQDGRSEELGHGVVVLATGAEAVRPAGYLYGQHPAVLTQRELEERIHAGTASAVQSVVMIQCVGSRDAEHPYCSRICCTQAVKNALALKAQNPAAQVAVLYRDVRTFGMRELLYREARARGVLFLEYSEAAPPVVRPRAAGPAGGLEVEVAVQPDGEVLRLDAELVALAAGIAPLPGNGALAQMFKVPLSEDGFFLEAHAKLRPLDFAADGVFLAGLAHSPRFIEETMAQANGAGVRAAALLSRQQLQSAAITAAVNLRLCAACGICVEACPYAARSIAEDTAGRRHALVREVLCQGCGACVAACPNGASVQRGFEFRQIFGMIDAAL